MRNTDYSITQQLLKLFGEEKLYKVWCDNNGMYGASKASVASLGYYVSPYVWRYLSYKFNWTREITDPTVPFVIGILRGKVPADYYRHIVLNLEKQS